MIKVQCDSCGKDVFKGGPATVYAHNFCSRRCSWDWKKGKCLSIPPRNDVRGSKNPMFKHGCAAKREKSCAWCSTSFLGHDGNRFCSRRCKGQWNLFQRFNGPRGEEWRKHYSQHNSGDNNANWRGGRSILPYTVGWNRGLSAKIRERDGNRCFACQDATRRLVVHHRDFAKTNHDPSNLITLCRTCHVRLHRGKWEFLPYEPAPVDATVLRPSI